MHQLLHVVAVEQLHDEPGDVSADAHGIDAGQVHGVVALGGGEEPQHTRLAGQLPRLPLAEAALLRHDELQRYRLAAFERPRLHDAPEGAPAEHLLRHVVLEQLEREEVLRRRLAGLCAAEGGQEGAVICLLADLARDEVASD